MNHLDRWNAHLANVGIDIPAEDLLEVADDDEASRTVIHGLVDAIEPIMRAETELRGCTAEIRRTLDRVEQLLDRGASNRVNGLGELQQTAHRYDLACAQLDTARNALQAMVKVYKATVGTTQLP